MTHSVNFIITIDTIPMYPKPVADYEEVVEHNVPSAVAPTGNSVTSVPFENCG